MWTPLRQEIEQIRKDLKISDDLFQPISHNAWKAIEENILETFCKISHNKTRPGWIWNCLKQETFSIASPDQFPAEIITALLKDEKKVWFFINETVNEATKFWWYEGEVKSILEVINESALIDEFYLASKKYEWLLCFNHHDILTVSGKELASKLENLVLNKSLTKSINNKLLVK